MGQREKRDYIQRLCEQSLSMVDIEDNITWVNANNKKLCFNFYGISDDTEYMVIVSLLNDDVELYINQCGVDNIWIRRISKKSDNELLDRIRTFTHSAIVDIV